MIELNNNFTTPEQSKRMLELGVPADSADCYYHHYFTNDPTPLLRVLQLQWNETIGAIRGKSGQKIEPCWSVGRLLEIMFKCTTSYEELTLTAGNYGIDYVLAVFEDAAKYGNLDFTKLNS